MLTVLISINNREDKEEDKDIKVTEIDVHYTVGRVTITVLKLVTWREVVMRRIIIMRRELRDASLTGGNAAEKIKNSPN